MKSYLPILSLLLLASCTSAYKSGQTPDDVYFSPARPQDEYVRVEKDDDRRYRSDEEYRDDRYLRMKVRDRRWSTLDDGYYSYTYYYDGFRNDPFNSYTYWNYYYNPYCSKTIIINPKSQAYNKPRTYNLYVFDTQNNSYNPKLPKSTNSGYNSSRTNTNSGSYRGSGTDAGSFLRNVFGGSSDNSKGGSYSGNSSNSSSSGSSNSSSGSSNSSGSRGNATRGKN